MERSPEEQAALAGAQGAAGAAQQGGQQALTEGRDYLQKPAHYFETLLGGNRAAMAQAVAAPTAQISANYRGSERALNQAGVRGAARDVAVADLNRQRASQIAGLTTGVQPYAAEQLAGLGQNMMAQAPGLLGTSGNIYGNLLNSGSANRVYARREGADTAAAIGGLARDVGEVAFRRPQAPGTPAATTPKAAGGATTPQTQPQTQTDAPAPPMGSPQQAPASIPYRRRAPVQQDIPNQPPPGYRFGTPTGDYDPNNNRAYT
jgi:hypothetical protein